VARLDRQAAFSGTEEPPAGLTLDVASLGAYMAEKIPGLDREFRVEKFKGGQSNPTYKLIGSNAVYVLRRRPPGKLLPSAHAIDREFRVMKALGEVGVPVPTTYFYCDDERVIGSAFYIVSYNPGEVYWNAELPGVSAEYRRQIYGDMSARPGGWRGNQPQGSGPEELGHTDNGQVH